MAITIFSKSNLSLVCVPSTKSCNTTLTKITYTDLNAKYKNLQDSDTSRIRGV